MIAVTKFDHYYSASEEHSQISKEAIKKAVFTSIKGATGSSGFPRRNIVPISGKMALYARKLSLGNELPEERTQRAVKRFLEDYKSYGGDDIPGGEDEATAGGEKSLTIQWKTLERASGIQVLEERSALVKAYNLLNVVWLFRNHSNVALFYGNIVIITILNRKSWGITWLTHVKAWVNDIHVID